MEQLDLAPAAQQWVNAALLWIGFGTLSGLAARLLVPGREPGVVGTVVIGVVGSTLGPLALVTLTGVDLAHPIGPVGFLAAAGGAAVLLLGYRVSLRMFYRRNQSNHGSGGQM